MAVAGAPGVGKTRLLEEVCADARIQGFQVIAGTCSRGGGAPLEPVIAALRRAEKDINGIRSWTQEADRRELSRLFPELAKGS